MLWQFQQQMAQIEAIQLRFEREKNAGFHFSQTLIDLDFVAAAAAIANASAAAAPLQYFNQNALQSAI